MAAARKRALAKALTHFIPRAPYFDAEEIRARAAAKHLRGLKPEAAVWLALIAYIRHAYTAYDSLRNEGYARDAARFFVHDAINAKLREWRACRFLTIEEADGGAAAHEHEAETLNGESAPGGD